jgi:predicted PurR-regulated permease PerM
MDGTLSDAQRGLPWPLRLLIAGACIVVIVAGLKAIAPILSVFLVALLLAMVLAAPMLWLMRRGLPRWAAVLLALLLVFVVGGFIIYLLAGSLAELRGRLPAYEQALRGLQTQGQVFLSRFLNPEQLQQVMAFLDPSKLAAPAARMAATVLEDLGHGLFILLLTAFFLIEFSAIFPRIDASGRSPRDLVVRFAEMTEDVQKFMGINALIGAIGATMYAILLTVMGVPFIPTWVVLYFFLGFIPAIGGILAVLPVLLLMILEHGIQRALLFMAIFVVLNFVNGDLIKPRILRGGFEISIVAVFFSLVFWNYVLGPVGVILAVPLTVTLKKLREEFAEDVRRAVLR